MTSIRLRPEQDAIVSGYTHGKAGIAAVPGSGKTFTLVQLAVKLIAQQDFAQGQEILIVTFTNSAVNSLQARIAHLVRQEHGLLPFWGYRVRTLHGLAHDIVRERPALVGLADDFVIVDERVGLDLQRDIAVQRLSEWWDELARFVDPEMDPRKARWAVERDIPSLVARYIQRAKDLQLSPDQVAALVQTAPGALPLLEFANQVYSDYQRSLAFRGAVDFDDLVRLALESLAADPDYLDRLRERWPIILEDEAQDSSQLQEHMLQLLSADQNWVRVGDPNQAINTTFTTANPEFLLRFLNTDANPDVMEYPLSVSGRSAMPIIELANELVRWTVEEHPVVELRTAFSFVHTGGVRRGLIVPTERGDPQPNPTPNEANIMIAYEPSQRVTPDQELEMVVAGEDYSLAAWFQELQGIAQDEMPTVAVLVPENSRGFKLVEMLRKYRIPYEELLRSTTATRHAVRHLSYVLDFLANPTDLKRLKRVYWELLPEDLQAEIRDDLDVSQEIGKFFARFANTEALLWPVTSQPVMGLEHLPDHQQWLVENIHGFLSLVRHWLAASTLPIDQLVLTISQGLFTDRVDIALGHKVAVLLRRLANEHPDWRLSEFVAELDVIGRNERRFMGFDDAESGYEPRPGVVTVATLHAAKGLEWDRVYLMSINNYGFPSVLPHDSFIAERWYARDSLNLEAELLAQLDLLQSGTLPSYVEGQATMRARYDYACERLRLLYVGITRARRELIMTWNTGRYWQDGKVNQPAVPLVVMNEYLQRAME